MSLVVPAVLPTSEQAFDDALTLFTTLPHITRIQIDVVDGRFASPPSWPYTAPHELRRRVDAGQHLPHLERLEYEIDLMCVDAETAAASWLALGAARLTLHAESVGSITHLIASMKKRYGHIVSLGLAINTESSLTLIEPILPDVSYVQVMGIARIGRQGQPFDPRVLEKIRVLHDRHSELAIQVDGGVSLENAPKLIALGVTNLVVGSALLRASDPGAVVESFEAFEGRHGM
ncbi:MAG: hypothetical protein AAB442_03045 [Patescibacteria group bacterium]